MFQEFDKTEMLNKKRAMWDWEYRFSSQSIIRLPASTTKSERCGLENSLSLHYNEQSESDSNGKKI